MEEGNNNEEKVDSPTNSQKTVSDDDEIDYSIKPEFYDSDLDNKDELWVQKKRRGHDSDAVLSCPACFTTLCLESQRHEQYVTQYRAIFVMNCKVEENRDLNKNNSREIQGKRRKKASDATEERSSSIETVKQVYCSVCLTEVGVFDEDEIYHFFNVLPSES
ncbi:hypothetical protein K1719_018023 [Acacia pycnantha]|nr:hypothetical protein K1719_018023 [Acacia pycnantha]